MNALLPLRRAVAVIALLPVIALVIACGGQTSGVTDAVTNDAGSDAATCGGGYAYDYCGADGRIAPTCCPAGAHCSPPEGYCDHGDGTCNVGACVDAGQCDAGSAYAYCGAGDRIATACCPDGAHCDPPASYCDHGDGTCQLGPCANGPGEDGGYGVERP
jgi:hypothetical protein